MKANKELLITWVLLGAGCASGLETNGPDMHGDHKPSSGEADSEDEEVDSDPEDEEEEPEPQEDDTPDPPPEEGFVPTDGIWLTVGEQMTADGCSMESWVLDGPGKTITINVLDEAELQLVGDYAPVLCSYDSNGFDCDSNTAEDNTPRDEYSLNAVIELELDTTADFDGPDYFEMRTNITADCSGSDCWMVEMATASFPCQMQVVTDVEAQ